MDQFIFKIVFSADTNRWKSTFSNIIFVQLIEQRWATGDPGPPVALFMLNISKICYIHSN